MDRLLLVVGGVLVAAVVATVVGRRTSAAPADNVHHIPVRLDRADFDRPEVAWLVAIFTSATCGTCAGVVERARPLAGARVVVQEIEVGAEPGLHERYGIDAVPTLVMADPTGEVKQAILGPTTTADLWAAMAEVRDAADGG